MHSCGCARHWCYQVGDSQGVFRILDGQSEEVECQQGLDSVEDWQRKTLRHTKDI